MAMEHINFGRGFYANPDGSGNTWAWLAGWWVFEGSPAWIWNGLQHQLDDNNQRATNNAMNSDVFDKLNNLLHKIPDQRWGPGPVAGLAAP
jgi:hypothetical protein